MKDVKIVIPARYNSSRFPGKPLVKILGISLVERVWLQCIKVVGHNNVYVATDSNKIITHCKERGMQFIKTYVKCLTGSDRVYEAAKKIKAKIVINVQGDEPLVSISDIKKIISKAKQNPSQIINAMCKISSKKDFFSNSVPKVVFNNNNDLLFMSRAPIPYSRKKKILNSFKQVCIYALPFEKLKIFSRQKKKTRNELNEDIEILRFLDLGMQVKMIEVSKSSIAVDYPKDISRVEKKILNLKKMKKKS